MKKPARVRRTFSALPATFRAGFVLLAAGILADVGYHLTHGLRTAHGHGVRLDIPTLIHLLVACGMTVTLAGLIRAGVQAMRTSTQKKEAI